MTDLERYNELKTAFKNLRTNLEMFDANFFSQGWKFNKDGSFNFDYNIYGDEDYHWTYSFILKVFYTIWVREYKKRKDFEIELYWNPKDDLFGTVCFKTNHCWSYEISGGWDHYNKDKYDLYIRNDIEGKVYRSKN